MSEDSNSHELEIDETNSMDVEVSAIGKTPTGVPRLRTSTPHPSVGLAHSSHGEQSSAGTSSISGLTEAELDKRMDQKVENRINEKFAELFAQWAPKRPRLEDENVSTESINCMNCSVLQKELERLKNNEKNLENELIQKQEIINDREKDLEQIKNSSDNNIRSFETKLEEMKVNEEKNAKEFDSQITNIRTVSQTEITELQKQIKNLTDDLNTIRGDFVVNKNKLLEAEEALVKVSFATFNMLAMSEPIIKRMEKSFVDKFRPQSISSLNSSSNDNVSDGFPVGNITLSMDEQNTDQNTVPEFNTDDEQEDNHMEDTDITQEDLNTGFNRCESAASIVTNTDLNINVMSSVNTDEISNESQCAPRQTSDNDIDDTDIDSETQSTTQRNTRSRANTKVSLGKQQTKPRGRPNNVPRSSHACLAPNGGGLFDQTINNPKQFKAKRFTNDEILASIRRFAQSETSIKNRSLPYEEWVNRFKQFQMYSYAGSSTDEDTDQIIHHFWWWEQLSPCCPVCGNKLCEKEFRKERVEKEHINKKQHFYIDRLNEDGTAIQAFVALHAIPKSK